MFINTTGNRTTINGTPREMLAMAVGILNHVNFALSGGKGGFTLTMPCKTDGGEFTAHTLEFNINIFDKGNKK